MQISHRAVQRALQKLLAPQEVWIEKAFPSIHRIADLVWPAAHLIFEVQCSPITVKEIRARHQDYYREGYTLVWILHDSCFNRALLTPAERFLLTQPHYFTNITAEGEGEIYRQGATIRWGRRLKRGERDRLVPPVLRAHCLRRDRATSVQVMSIWNPMALWHRYGRWLQRRLRNIPK